MGSSTFAEAKLSPGEVAVLESEVNMTDTGYAVLFDRLEWMEGEKLSACCWTGGRTPYELECPFESDMSVKGSVEWKSEKINCPQYTSKVSSN